MSDVCASIEFVEEEEKKAAPVSEHSTGQRQPVGDASPNPKAPVSRFDVEPLQQQQLQVDGRRRSTVSFALAPEEFSRQSRLSPTLYSPGKTPSRCPTDVTALQSALEPERSRSYSVFEEQDGSWRWWLNLLRSDMITTDHESRRRLQGLPGNLYCQFEDHPTSVELSFQKCYLAPTAPLHLATLLGSPLLPELSLVTSLHLGENYYTDKGLGRLLSALSESNVQRSVMPNLRELHLCEMGLDKASVTGLMHYLFPVDIEATNAGDPADTDRRIGGSRVPALPDEYLPEGDGCAPVLPLFPSLTVLNLSDNPDIGMSGLVTLLRCLIADHYDPRVLEVINLSRCGLQRVSRRYMKQFFRHLPKALLEGRNPVYPDTFVLSGNEFPAGEESLFKPCSDPSISIVL